MNSTARVTRLRRKLTEKDLERMMIPRRHWDAQFDQISDDDTNGMSVRERVRKYLQNLDTMVDRGFGLWLWGNNGRGKTCASVVVLKEARRRSYTGLFMSAAGLKEAVINKTRYDSQETLWERARSVDILVLDDLGKGTEDSKGFGERLLDELIRTRSGELKVTWLTANMDPKRFKDKYKTSTLAAMKECVLPVKVYGPDRRDETMHEMEQLFS